MKSGRGKASVPADGSESCPTPNIDRRASIGSFPIDHDAREDVCRVYLADRFTAADVIPRLGDDPLRCVNLCVYRRRMSGS